MANKSGLIRLVTPSMVILAIVISLSSNGQDIHRTACQGNLAKLDSLLGDTTSINVVDRRGRSLLHYSVGCNREEVFDYLVERGIDINIEENVGWTPLLLAIMQKREVFVQKLLALNAKANFNHENKEGTSVLMEAILNDDLSTARLLIEKGADVDALNNRGNSPLSIARREGLSEIVSLLLAHGAKQEGSLVSGLEGEYMGQPKPGLTATIFAPNFISTENFTHNGVFHPNGREFYFTIETFRYNRGTIMVSRKNGEKWSKPEPAPIPGDYREVGPFISKDGMKMFFASSKPIDESDSLKRDVDIWVMERMGDNWGPPKHLGEKINTDGNDWFATLSDDGAIYYYIHNFKDGSGNIYYSENIGGEFQEGVLIEGVDNEEYYNYDPYVAPDESYLIFASTKRPDGIGNADLYISFKDDQDMWSKPENMGDGVNSEESEYAPLMTPDGKYLFFARGHGDIYWVDAQVIENLK